MNRFCRVILLAAAATAGCDSRIVPASGSTAPLYKVVVPADLSSTWALGNKDGTSTTVNARETYLDWHRMGWDAYLVEFSKGSNGHSADLDLPFPQCTGYELRAYKDGYDQCRRAHRKL